MTGLVVTGLCSGAELRELESNEGVMFGRGERGGLSDTVMTSKGLQEAREQVRQHVSIQPERNVTDVRQKGLTRNSAQHSGSWQLRCLML